MPSIFLLSNSPSKNFPLPNFSQNSLYSSDFSYAGETKILWCCPIIFSCSPSLYPIVSKNIVLKTCDNLISLIYELITDWNNKQTTQETEESQDPEEPDKPDEKKDIFKEYNEDYKKVEPEKEKEQEKEKKKLKSKVKK